MKNIKAALFFSLQEQVEKSASIASLEQTIQEAKTEILNQEIKIGELEERINTIKRKMDTLLEGKYKNKGLKAVYTLYVFGLFSYIQYIYSSVFLLSPKTSALPRISRKC